MDKRKLRRWVKRYERYDEAGLVYRRENWLYRDLTRWLDKNETVDLVSELAETFGVPMPKVYITQTAALIDSQYVAAFKVNHTPSLSHASWWLHFRVYREYKPRSEYWAVDNKCQRYKLFFYHVPARTVRSCAILHEFAHYLSFEWWGHPLHDQQFLAVNEMLHEWYKRKKRKDGVRTRYRLERLEGEKE